MFTKATMALFSMIMFCSLHVPAVEPEALVPAPNTVITTISNLSGRLVVGMVDTAFDPRTTPSRGDMIVRAQLFQSRIAGDKKLGELSIFLPKNGQVFQAATPFPTPTGSRVYAQFSVQWQNSNYYDPTPSPVKNSEYFQF